MRFEPLSFPNAGAHPARRRIERANAVVEVMAPASWTSARIEAWLDWADATMASRVSDNPKEALLAGGPARYAGMLAMRGLERGLFGSADEAAQFEDAVFATMLAGIAAPGDPITSAPDTTVLDLAALEAPGVLVRHVGKPPATISRPKTRRWRSARACKPLWTRSPRCEGGRASLRRSQSQSGAGPCGAGGARQRRLRRLTVHRDRPGAQW